MIERASNKERFGVRMARAKNKPPTQKSLFAQEVPRPTSARSSIQLHGQMQANSSVIMDLPSSLFGPQCPLHNGTSRPGTFTFQDREDLQSALDLQVQCLPPTLRDQVRLIHSEGGMTATSMIVSIERWTHLLQLIHAFVPDPKAQYVGTSDASVQTLDTELQPQKTHCVEAEVQTLEREHVEVGVQTSPQAQGDQESQCRASRQEQAASVSSVTRSLNLRIIGVAEAEDDALSDMDAALHFFTDGMHVKAGGVVSATRVGAARSDRPRHLLVRFQDALSRLHVLQHGNHLRGTSFSVQEDLSPLQLCNRKEELCKVRAARLQKKWAVYRGGAAIILDQWPSNPWTGYV